MESKINKIVTQIFFTMAMGMSAHAYDYSENKAEVYIKPEVGKIKIEDDMATEYGVAVGYGVIYKKISFDIEFFINYYSMDNDSDWSGFSLGPNMLFGYNIYKRFTPYVSIGYVVPTIINSGFTYGVGLKYQILDRMSVDAGYKLGKLSNTSGEDLDYSEFILGLKFNFKLD